MRGLRAFTPHRRTRAPALNAMAFQTYLVGGAVRDALLGCAAGDRDWVVVGATAEELLALGYRPVGQDFPVFLHPETQEEVALARTERKIGRGYRGFAVQADPTVTLEDDLRRRDLTINAMARAADGTLIDPYGGLDDLRAGILRHVGPAFGEDPVRILRLARFAARWPHFTVSPETRVLCQRMVDSGEADALVPERVWQELSRGLMEKAPLRLWEVLNDCGAWPRLFPQLKWDHPSLGAGRTDVRHGLEAAFACATQLQAPLVVRAACLGHLLLGDHATESCLQHWHERLRPPQEVLWLTEVLHRRAPQLLSPQPRSADAMLTLLDALDAWRRPQRLGWVTQASHCLRADAGPAGSSVGSAELNPSTPSQCHALTAADGLLPAWRVASAIDSAQVAADAQRQGLKGAAVGLRIRQSRWAALTAAGWAA